MTILGVAGAFGLAIATSARAGESPPDCNANSLGTAVIPTIDGVPVPPGQCVIPGQAIEYVVAAFVSENDPEKPGVIFCDVMGGELAVTLPNYDAMPLRDGQFVPTAGYPDTPPIPTIGNADGANFTFITTVPTTYVVDEAHADMNGLLNVRVDYGQTAYIDLIGMTQENAIVLTDPAQEGTASITNALPLCVPSVDLQKSAEPSEVCLGVPTLVTYTYTVTNTSSAPAGLGDLPSLTGVSLVDDQCETIEGPIGDDGDGLLEPGESWTYTCTRLVDGDLVNVATVTAVAVAPFPTQQVVEGVEYTDTATAQVVGIDCTFACCLPDGSCQELTQDDCVSAGGDYQGDGVTCDQVECPLPKGACCFEDGSCAVRIAAECAEAGGAYLGDQTICSPNPCPPPTGACCAFDGSCTTTSQADCEMLGGLYQGNFTVCDPNPCGQPTGACCSPDGSCAVVSEVECLGGGGEYQGNFVTCAPELCPQPEGACCLADGSCEPLTQADCTESGGSWQGAGVPCDPHPCPPIKGACCAPSGACSVVTASECAASGGTYQGDGTTCEPGLCPQPTGACCFVDGTCATFTQEDCFDASGLFQGPGTSCDLADCPQPVGACCFPNGICAQLEESRCATDGGVYQGDFVLCVPNPCPQPEGACCFSDGTCEVLTQEACRLAGASANGLLVQDSVIIVEPVFGSYRVTKDMRACVDADCGFPGGADPCDPFPDDGLITYVYRLTNAGESVNAVIGWVVDTGVPGAVIEAGFIGGDGVQPSMIQVLNGGSQAMWSFFDDPIDPGEQSVELYIVSSLGPAAVDTNALGDFALDSPGACFGPAVQGDFCIGALWQGAGTTCDPNPCDQPDGACCLPSGFCDTLTADDCAAAGGDYQGDYVLCQPGLCPEPTGACCFVDGSCLLLTQTECHDASGLFQGPGTSCDLADCPQPVGACCFPNGICAQLEESRCTTDGGVYQGDFVLCVPNPCPQPEGACCFSDGTCEVLTQEACRLAGASANGLLVQDSVIIVEPVFGSYRVTKDMRACVDADCGFPGGADPCDPFPDDGLVTYLYRLTNAGESANAVIGWVVDTGVPGAITEAGFFSDGGIEPSSTEVLNEGSQVVWTFYDDPIDPGEQSVELYIVSSLGPAAVDTNALGDFALDSPGACFGPAVQGDFCIGALWQGAGTTCDPNPCDQPDGACCLPSGFCDTLTADDCAAAGGDYQGDYVLCQPGLCPEPTGACCFVDGSCLLLTQTECHDASGLFQGPGTSCDLADCPQPVGACCFPDGTCTQVREDRCTTDGGVYQGDFVLCVPNPCPQPEGACCFSDGTCEVLTQEACRLAGASANGLLVQDSVIIVEPVFGSYRVTKDMRACVDADCGFPGGTDPCDPFPDDGLVTYLYRLTNAGESANAVIGWVVDTGVPGAITEAGFFSDGGIEPSSTEVLNEGSQVVWTFYDDPIDPGEQSVELYIVSSLGPAAVDTNALGDFALDSPGACFGPAVQGDFCIGALWQGAGTTCDPNPCDQPDGACCLESGFCKVTTAAECASFGGLYQGDYVNCAPGLCPQPQGACCLDDGSCTELTFEECLEAGGLYQGDLSICEEGLCPQPTGACCFESGLCTSKTAEACTMQGGTYQGDGTQCDPSPCPPPTGACCFDDGSCDELTLDACLSAGGIYQGNFTVCEEGVCPPPTGACCFANGNCTSKTEEACVLQGGTYQGDGTQCDPSPCEPPIGACCFEDGSCLELSQADCFDAGGIYQGNFTTCDPNDCPQPPGACCFPNGSCTTVTQERCESDGGVFQGDGTSCDPNECPSPPGACCFSDGTCEILTQQECRDAGLGSDGLLAEGETEYVEQFFGTYTVVKSYHVCVDPVCAFGSSAMGQGAEPCDPFPDDGLLTYVYRIANAEESMNAVIGWVLDSRIPGAILEAGFLRNGGIEPSEILVDDEGSQAEFRFFKTPIAPGEASVELYVISALGPGPVDSTLLGDFALDASGLCVGPVEEGEFCIDTIWQGPGTECGLCVGACCLPNGMCIIATLEECDAAGGDYQGLFTDCTVDCPGEIKGACCLPDGACTVVPQAECDLLGGTYQGDLTTCDQVDCPQPTGACCLEDGSCLDGLTELECADEGGLYQGDGATCGGVECPQPRGACCFPDGSCTFVTEEQCLLDGGIPQGLDSSCQPNECPPPLGACCLPDGSCVEQLAQADCFGLGGIWLGRDTTCDGAECPQPTGACCLDDGSCLDGLTQAACADEGGLYQGDFTACDQVDCPQPTGACCLEDGSCLDGPTQAQCADEGGLYQGDGTGCADVECPVIKGACCLINGACTVVPREVCDTLGGTYQGDLTICVPSPCEQPGACCLAEGLCMEATETECASLDGEFQGAGVSCSPLALGQPGTYRLGNHPDGGAAPPLYGLRLDELFDVTNGTDVFTFDFEAPGAEMLLDYDGTTIRIHGTAFGGRDTGNGYDPAWTSLIEIDLTYAATGVAPGDDDLTVTTPSMSNSGEVRWLADGTIVPILDEANGDGLVFRFGDEQDDQGHRGFDGLAGWGWLSYGGGPAAGTRDWLFTAREICAPEPAGACCLPDGTCIEDVSPAACAYGLGGVYQGDGTLCDPLACFPLGESCCEDGYLIRMTFLYTGEDCAATWHDQDPDKVNCDDYGPLPDRVRILSTDDEDPYDGNPIVWFDGIVDVGDTYTLDALAAGESKFKSRTFTHVFDLDGDLLQSVEFHTSCSQPLETGFQFGAHLLVDCVGEDEPIPGDCCASGDKPRALIILYTGEDCSATVHQQDPGKVSCDDFVAPLPDMVYVLSTNKGDPDDQSAKVWFAGEVLIGETFQIDAVNEGDDHLPSETWIHILEGPGGDELQRVRFHTSCSQPLAEGFQFGASLIVGCIGENEPVEGDCCAAGKPRVLSMQYTAEDCSATSHGQDPGKVDCDDFGPLPGMVRVLSTNKSNPNDGGAKVWFDGIVQLGSTYDIDAGNAGENRLENATFIHILDVAGNLLQSVEFHTSCSQPLFEGNQFGASLLVGCIGENEAQTWESGLGTSFEN